MKIDIKDLPTEVLWDMFVNPALGEIKILTIIDQELSLRKKAGDRFLKEQEKKYRLSYF